LAKTKAKAAAVKLVMHKHGAEKYSVAVPSNWEIREDMKLDLYSISLVCVRPLKPNDVFRENMNVVFENVDSSFQLKEYVEANITSMTKGLGQFKVIGTGELKGGKIPSQYLIYTQVSDQYNGTLKAVVFFYLDGKGRAYSVTCTSTDKSFDNYYSLFQQIGKSFTLPKK
jgi:hypothetical protein